MTHLRIEQNSTQETVTNNIITKLYEIVYNSTLDQSSNLSGTLYVPKAYGDEIDYLEDQFQDLHIIAGDRYLKIADPEVKRILGNQYGDGVGITLSNIAPIIVFPSNLFSWNNDIVSFNELSSFPNVTQVQEGAFTVCGSLQSVDFSKISIIPKNCFNSSTNLTTIGNCKPTVIGENAFKNTKITNIDLSKLTSLGNYAFIGCSSLISADLTNCTESSIPTQCFRDCTSLTSVTISSSIKDIGYEAFRNDSSLTTFDFTNIETIGQSAFHYSGLSGNISLPACTTITGRYSFCYCNITSVSLPVLTSVGTETFHRANSLVSASIPSLTSLGTSMFNYAQSLTTVTFSPNVTSIGNYCFENTSLTGTIGFSNLTYLGEGSFKNCTRLTSVTSLGSITNIPNEAFYNCSGITSFPSLSDITSIGNRAFYNTKISGTLSLPNLTSLGVGAFSICSQLTSITSLGSITNIPNEAFYNCTNLTSIILPSTLVSIGRNAFRGCGFTSLTIPDSVTTFDIDAFTGSQLASLVFGSNPSLSYIGGGAFNSCKFTSITLPDSVTFLGGNAFYQCRQLGSVTIGTGIQEMHYPFTNAMAWNAGGFTLTIKATTPPTFDLDTTEPIINPTVIYVPAGSVNAYKTADTWSRYASIIQAISS